MLFGHQNDDNTQQTPGVEPITPVSVNPLAVDPDSGVGLPTAPEELEHSTEAPVSVLDQPMDHMVTAATPVPAAPVVSQAANDDNDDILTPPSSSDDLLHLKQQALEELSPLVGHLEQSPEEKFRTTMMMIQSSDNQALIKDAYAAAQQISDDKARAQALLDIVNEINYFTQQSTN